MNKQMNFFFLKEKLCHIYSKKKIYICIIIIIIAATTTTITTTFFHITFEADLTSLFVIKGISL
jgi:hypothetical protein